MKNKFANFVFCFVTVLLTNSVFSAEPTISQVTVRQRWPWSRLVDIDFVVSCEETQSVDIAVQAFNGATPLTLPADSFTGDLFGVSYGAHHIVWDPTVTAYTNNGVLPDFSVALAPTPVSLYMIVDLTKSTGEEGQIEYLSESDLAGGAYGTVQTNPVAGVESIAWTGVTGDPVYKDQKLVLRRIHAGSVTNLSNGTISVSKGYFISVFELTQNQWNRITGSYPVCKFSDKNGPVEKSCSYNALRGSTTEGINWPTTGSLVGTNSVIYMLRNKTRISGFDLPDNDQWQYACRAATSTIFNDNDYNATTTHTDGTNAWMEVLGCYSGNAGGTTAVVGSYTPNAWGLYDMHGNVLEWTLDYYNGSDRTRRGGSYFYDANRCTSSFAKEGSASDADGYGMNGARLVINY